MQTSGITSENVNQLTDSINENIKDYFKKRKKGLVDTINSVIDKNQLKEKLKTSVGSALDAANSNAQEAINNKINEFNKEFEGAG